MGLSRRGLPSDLVDADRPPLDLHALADQELSKALGADDATVERIGAESLPCQRNVVVRAALEIGARVSQFGLAEVVLDLVTPDIFSRLKRPAVLIDQRDGRRKRRHLAVAEHFHPRGADIAPVVCPLLVADRADSIDDGGFAEEDTIAELLTDRRGERR
jgi:hypothetical protein